MTRAQTVTEVVHRLVQHYKPERVYLVGSSARGEDRPDSDLDFLVVLPDKAPRSMLFDGQIYQRLWDIPAAVDIITLHDRTFRERSGWVMSLPAIALREGKLEYDASALPDARSA
jgi:predicted nucleotidyltransferase